MLTIIYVVVCTIAVFAGLFCFLLFVGIIDELFFAQAREDAEWLRYLKREGIK